MKRTDPVYMEKARLRKSALKRLSLIDAMEIHRASDENSHRSYRNCLVERGVPHSDLPLDEEGGGNGPND